MGDIMEYEFPSGNPVFVPGVSQITWLAHVGMSAILVASIIVIVRRCRRKVSVRDIGIWF